MRVVKSVRWGNNILEFDDLSESEEKRKEEELRGEEAFCRWVSMGNG